MSRPEDELRQRLIKALGPEIKIEPIESGAVNDGFPDLLLAVPGADGLFPIELKIGELTMDAIQRVIIDYRPGQNAKHAELRRRIRNVWTLIFVPKLHYYYLVRNYQGFWNLPELREQCSWHDSDLSMLKLALIQSVLRGAKGK